MMRTLALALSLSLALSSCASMGTLPDESESRTRTTRVETHTGAQSLDLTTDNALVAGEVQAPVERVWAVLPEVYAELGLRNAVPDEARRSIGVTRLSLNRSLGRTRLSTLLDCGFTVSMPNADQYAIVLNASTRLHSAGSGATRVETVVSATGRPMDTAGSVDCRSRGALERRIVEEIGRRM